LAPPLPVAVLRLTPLFVFFVEMLWSYALALSDFRLRESVPRAVIETSQWLTFTIAGMPDLNHSLTPILGGQAWSLPYEWWFYLTLPLAAACLSLRPSMSWVGLGLLGAAGAVWWVSRSGSWPVVATFTGGIAAAYAVRYPRLRAWACSPAATVICLAALAALTRFSTAFATMPLLLLSIAFAVIACGNTLFRALSWPAARRLGEIGYSVYCSTVWCCSSDSTGSRTVCRP
jgi:peptidoglycan/LPS O-acetylase OafA/YrhL